MVITGGTAGMGLAGAKLFVDEGASVFITGRRQDALDEAVKQIGRNATGVRATPATSTARNWSPTAAPPPSDRTTHNQSRPFAGHRWREERLLRCPATGRLRRLGAGPSRWVARVARSTTPRPRRSTALSRSHHAACHRCGPHFVFIDKRD
ncbi:SDR family NAD(P)-dependent oxidoreductase [Nonomuraea sp. NPDC050404]|uniref:SDR family NAD(P)-dependent oxidoreductase n=1 Tax=Nonomuraea sp. NPDC050404 TaxID=3155783 RepID=UPI0033CF0659